MPTPQRQATIIVLFSALTVLASMGIRQSFGLFLQPIGRQFLGRLAGWLYDATGSYDPVWWLAIALGVAAALIHLPIADRPVQSSNA